MEEKQKSKNMVSKVIYSIVANEDVYNFQHITCFNKPWAILYQSFNPLYFDIFLFYTVYYENFMVENYFAWDKFIYNLDNNFHHFSEDILNKKFGLQVDKVYFDTEEDFYKKVEGEILKKSRILVPSDLIELPYNQQYHKESHIHFFIIKGFDSNREIFFILDNMHIDDGAGIVYKDFVLEYNRLYKLTVACFENFFTGNSDKYFWILNAKNGQVDLNINDTLEDHMVLLKKINNGQVTLRTAEQDFVSNYSKDYYGMGRAYAKILNYKFVYYDILVKFLKYEGISESNLNIITNLKNNIVKDWEEIRLIIMYNLAKNPDKIKMCTKNILTNLQKEREFRNILIGVIEQLISCNEYIENKLISKLIIKNTNKAIITNNSKVVTIEHSSDYRYDTWISQDCAPQLLYEFCTEDNITLECKVEIINKINYPFQSGIILKTKSGKKYLYGIHRLNEISLFCPQNEEGFELLKKSYYQKYVYLKVYKKSDNIQFYFKVSTDEIWILIYEMTIKDDVIQMGLFSKTWEMIKHKTNFSELKLEVNNKFIQNAYI